MNKYQCQVCGAVSYSAASQENLKDNSCLECDGRVEMVNGDKMNADAIIRAFRERAKDSNRRGFSGEASELMEISDLIKSLQAQLSDEKIVSQSLRNAANGYKAQLAASQRRERAAVRRLQYEWDDILPVEYTGTTHHLKTAQPYYAASEIGEKTFELRKDDRNYAVGDILHLYEWDGNRETGRSHYKQVTYILRDAPYVPDGYACLAILPVTPTAVKDAKIEWRGPQEKGDKDE